VKVVDFSEGEFHLCNHFWTTFTQGTEVYVHSAYISSQNRYNFKYPTDTSKNFK